MPEVYQALNQAVLLSFSPRQTRKGGMTSWKAFVPGYSGKLAIEAVDRAMRGETSPSPVYEGESGIVVRGLPCCCLRVLLLQVWMDFRDTRGAAMPDHLY